MSANCTCDSPEDSAGLHHREWCGQPITGPEPPECKGCAWPGNCPCYDPKPYVTPGHPVQSGAGYDCQCGQCLAMRAELANATPDMEEA